jgi:hypothetical protein
MLLKRNSVKKFQDGGQVRQSRSNNSFVDSGLAQAGTQHVTVDISHKSPEWRDKPAGQSRRSAAAAASGDNKGLKGYTSDIEYATQRYNAAMDDFTTWAAGVADDEWGDPEIMKKSNEKQAAVQQAQYMMSQTENIKDTFDKILVERQKEAKDAPAIDFNTGPGYALVNESTEVKGKDNKEYTTIQTKLVTVKDLNEDISNGTNKYSVLSVGDAITERRNNPEFSKYTPSGGVIENIITKSMAESEFERSMFSAFDDLGITFDENKAPMLVQGVGSDGTSYNMNALSDDKTRYVVPISDIATVLGAGGDIGVQVTEGSSYKTNIDALNYARNYVRDKMIASPGLKEALPARAMYAYSNLSAEEAKKYKDFTDFFNKFSEKKIKDFMMSKYNIETKKTQEVSGHRPADESEGGANDFKYMINKPWAAAQEGVNVVPVEVNEFYDMNDGKREGNELVNQASGATKITVMTAKVPIPSEHDGDVFTPGGLASKLSRNGNRWQTKNGENIQDYLDNSQVSGIIETPSGSDITTLMNIPSRKDPHTDDWVVADDVMRFYVDMRKFAAKDDRINNKFSELRKQNPDKDLKVLQKMAYDATYNEFLASLPGDKRLAVQSTVRDLIDKKIKKFNWANQEVFAVVNSGDAEDALEGAGATKVDNPSEYKAVIDRAANLSKFTEEPGNLNLYKVKINYPLINGEMVHIALSDKHNQEFTPGQREFMMNLIKESEKSENYGNNFESFFTFSGDNDEGIEQLLKVPDGQ